MRNKWQYCKPIIKKDDWWAIANATWNLSELAKGDLPTEYLGRWKCDDTHAVRFSDYKGYIDSYADALNYVLQSYARYQGAIDICKDGVQVAEPRNPIKIDEKTWEELI